MAKPTSYDNAKLFELARHLLPDDPSLVEQVRLAIDRPAAYLERYADELEMRGIGEVRPDLPWIALVDGLYARDAVREIDWKSDIETIFSLLDDLAALQPARPDRWEGIWENEAGEDENEPMPDDVLPLIGRRLLGEGLALATIDIDSDSYVLIVLPSNRIKAAEHLAERAGYGAILQWS